MTGLYQFLKKYGVAIGFTTGALICGLMYMIILGGYPEFNPTKEELYEKSIFDFGIFSTYFLIGLAIFLVLGFSSAYAIKNLKDSMKGLIGFVVILALYFITYQMGDGTLSAEFVKSDPSLLPMDVKFEEGVTQSTSVKQADGLIKFGYVMLILASIAMVLASVKDFVKQS
jgi:hypothetical protein